MAADEPFQGFQSPTSNTTYTPNQFFDVVLPVASRGVVRLVAYLIRQTLGWSDAEGNPREAHIQVPYRDLEAHAGIAQSKIRAALEEAVAARFLQCVRPGQSHRLGVQGQVALYELCWDECEAYTTAPERFQGFFAGNGNLTYIPNEFFDVLIPQEPLSVIRVVGAIIRNTIGFQTRYGMRRQQIALSFTQLQQRTGIVSRRALSEALKAAIEHNYIEVVEPGCFDPNAGQNSRAATYGLRWLNAVAREENANLKLFEDAESKQPEKNASKRIPGERLQKDTGRTPPKGYRERLQKDTGNASKRILEERFQKDTDNKITNKNNISKEQQQSAAAAAKEDSALYEMLRNQEGFNEKTTCALIATYSEERIRRQCGWLSRRAPARNRLGMLRRSIEEDWPEPPPAFPSEKARDESAGVVFAACFYAGRAGNPALPAAPPSQNDRHLAEAYVARLLEFWPDRERIADWGRHFGAHVREAEQNNPKAICSLVVALRQHGDGYLHSFQKQAQKRRREACTRAWEAHEQRYQSAYHAYVQTREQEIVQAHPQIWAEFVACCHKKRDELEHGVLSNSKLQPMLLANFDTQESHRERFCRHFQARPECPVLNFREWDKTKNPEPFSF